MWVGQAKPPSIPGSPPSVSLQQVVAPLGNHLEPGQSSGTGTPKDPPWSGQGTAGEGSISSQPRRARGPVTPSQAAAREYRYFSVGIAESSWYRYFESGCAFEKEAAGFGQV